MTTRLSELQLIKEAMNTTKSTRMQQRYQVILLHLKNYQNIRISDVVERYEHTVEKYINTYKNHGIGALIPRPREGARPKLTSEQEALLIQIVSTKTPAMQVYLLISHGTLNSFVYGLRNNLMLLILMVVCVICYYV